MLAQLTKHFSSDQDATARPSAESHPAIIVQLMRGRRKQAVLQALGLAPQKRIGFGEHWRGLALK